jgi:hypothetical protein
VVLFYLDRIDMLSGTAGLPRRVSEYMQQHLYVTASGIFSQRYLRWTLEVLGADHILFLRLIIRLSEWRMGRHERSSKPAA